MHRVACSDRKYQSATVCRFKRDNKFNHNFKTGPVKSSGVPHSTGNQIRQRFQSNTHAHQRCSNLNWQYVRSYTNYDMY